MIDPERARVEDRYQAWRAGTGTLTRTDARQVLFYAAWGWMVLEPYEVVLLESLLGE